MMKRRTFAGCFALTLAAWAAPSWAGSYLTRSAMLLKSADVEARALRRRLHDKELARLTHRLALERLEAAKDMLVPEEVVKAHPHLLLALEGHERAAEAAVRGDHEDVLVALARAREETTTFEAVLRRLGWDLPELS